MHYWDLMHCCYYIILLQLIFEGPIIFIIAVTHNCLFLLQLKVIIAINLYCIPLLQLNELMSIVVFYCN